MKINRRVEAGAGDISDPVIYGRLTVLNNDIAVIVWEYKAWYTTGHIGLKFGPLRRVYERNEFERLLRSKDYDQVRFSPPPRKITHCSCCGQALK